MGLGGAEHSMMVKRDKRDAKHASNTKFDLTPYLACKTACKTCKTFQGPGEKSVEMFPPQVVQCPAFCRRTLE